MCRGCYACAHCHGKQFRFPLSCLTGLTSGIWEATGEGKGCQSQALGAQTGWSLSGCCLYMCSRGLGSWTSQAAVLFGCGSSMGLGLWWNPCARRSAQFWLDMATLTSLLLGLCKVSGRQLQLNQSPEVPTQGLGLKRVCADECTRAPGDQETQNGRANPTYLKIGQ